MVHAEKRSFINKKPTQANTARIGLQAPRAQKQPTSHIIYIILPATPRETIASLFGFNKHIPKRIFRNSPSKFFAFNTIYFVTRFSAFTHITSHT
jgi:hypothetical protein